MTTGDFDGVDEATPHQSAAYVASASHEDRVEFLAITRGLAPDRGLRGDGRDNYGQPMNGSLGPHSLRAVRRAADEVKPDSILEIGFNNGYSSAMWLHFRPEAKIVSVDISDRDSTLYGVGFLSTWHHDRFRFVLADSKFCEPLLPRRDYDLAFVDGDHLEDGVYADLQLCIRLGVPHILLDDWWRVHGPGVKPAVARCPELRKVWSMGNIALLENTNVIGTKEEPLA